MSQGLRIRLLGPPSLQVGGENLTPTVSDRAIALLAFLATAAGHRARREAIMDLLWADGPEAQIQSNLRTLLTRLRKKLPGLLAADRTSVAFHADASWWIDVADFEAWTRSSEGLPPERAVQQRERALGLVRGEFVEGLAPGDAPRFKAWLDGRRKSIHAIVRIQRMKLAQAWLSLGRPERACTVAEGMIATDPLDESGVMELMSAHAVLGDTGRALREFHDFRVRLEEALNLEPSAAARDLATQVARSALPTAPSSRQATAPILGLPADTTSFLGRDADVRRLRELLRDRTHRLVTILGYGGLGKSRLAREVARTVGDEFAHGVLFVPLPVDGGGDDPEGSIRTAISRAAGLPPADQGAVDEWIADRDLLLILDGAEAWTEARDALVALIRAAPLVTVVVTSREQLGIRAETVLRLGGLTPSDAVILFRERAHARIGEILDDGEAEAVAAICELVSGSPLGVEIAASNAGAMSLDAITAQLRDAPERIESDRPDMPPRHRSFAGVFDTSWKRLGEEERGALGRLALFVDAFDEATAWEGARVAPEPLARLRAKSLLLVQAGLYSLHAVVRHLVAAQGSGSESEAEHVRGLLLGFLERPRVCTLPGWYLQNIEAAAARAAHIGETVVLGRTTERLVRALGPRAIPILHAGITTADDPTTRRRMAVSLAKILQEQLRHEEGLDLLRRDLAETDPGEDNEITWLARAQLAALHAARGEHDVARTLAKQAEDGAQRMEAAGAAVAACLVYVGTESPGDDPAEIVAMAEQGLQQARDLHLRREQIGFLRALGRLKKYRDNDAARGHLEQALALAEEMGDQLIAVSISLDFATLEWLHGNQSSAAGLYRKALARAEELPAPALGLRARYNVANTTIVTGSLEEAERHARVAVRMAERSGVGSTVLRTRTLLANILLRLGDLEGALQENLDCLAAADPNTPIADVLEHLIGALGATQALGRPDAADYAARIEAAVQAGTTPYREAWAWTMLGRYWTSQGENARARAASERGSHGTGIGRNAAELALTLDDALNGRTDAARARLASGDWYDNDKEQDAICWDHYRLLVALDDPSAAEVLEQLANAIRKQADLLRDPRRRVSFLRRAGCNAEIMAEWEIRGDR